MKPIVKLDEKDVQILRILVKNARTRLKDIAKECGITSVSVLNRIKRLRKLKVITGAALFPDLSKLGLPIVATIGVIVNGNQEDELIKIFSKQIGLIEPSESIGKYDFCTLVFSASIRELNKINQLVKKELGVREVALNLWSGQPHLVFENIDFQPIRGSNNG